MASNRDTAALLGDDIAMFHATYARKTDDGAARAAADAALGGGM